MIPLIGGNNPKMIEGDDQQRSAKCLRKINNLLNQYDCILIPEIIIRGDGNISNKIIVKPMPRTGKINI